MAKNLVIVESPAKAKTIKRYLGNDYSVSASYGHVRDLPVKELGIDIEKDWQPHYVTIRGSGKTIASLKKSAKGAEAVYLATDPDREGEAIAWHLKEALGLDDDRAWRVVFNEITKPAIKAAFEHPGKIDIDKVNAQQARRFLDRVVGYKISPLLWKKVRKGLSAGRVQSVAVRLVVEREDEISAFVPEEYWKLGAWVWPASEATAMTEDGTPKEIRAELVKKDGENIKPGNEDEMNAVLSDLEGADFKVDNITKKRTRQRPSPPFITSTLQQRASTQLRMSARRTMRVAQGLYEGVGLGPMGTVGLITYMRTDSVNVSKVALGAVRDYVKENFDDKYLPAKPNFYKSRSGAQEAHEAIRPTDVTLTPEKVSKYLDRDQQRLYELIWKRFVASQMTPAEFDSTDITVAAGAYSFQLKGRVLKFPGHTIVTGRSPSKEEQQELPEMQEGQDLLLRRLEPTQHFTEPPARYNEASLVRELEKRGIGRPSTYAAIISTIQDRQYVEQKERRFYATELGMLVTRKLVEHFPKILDVEFTSHMEDELDDVEQGKLDYLATLNEFYGPFQDSLERATTEMKKEKAQETGETCPECGEPLVTRWSKHGKFIGCSAYPKCKYIKPGSDEGEDGGAEDPKGRTCPECGKTMVVRSRRRMKMLVCPDNPSCGPTHVLDDKDEIVKVPEDMTTCEKCGAPMAVRKSRRGFFLGCSAYPKCKHTKQLPGYAPKTPPPVETDLECEKCGSKFLIRTGKRGRFLACSGFPKCRNIKPVPTGKKCPECGEDLVEGMRKGQTVHRCSNRKCKYADFDVEQHPVPGQEEKKEEAESKTE